MTRIDADRFEAARSVADAVLYEGYVLYPYRASSKKNQLRWQFGVLTPRAFSEVDGSDRWAMRTECLVDNGGRRLLSVRLRFLQVQRRSVEAVLGAPGSNGERFSPVGELEVEGEHHVAWDEALDQIVDVAPLEMSPNGAVHEEHFTVAGGTEYETLRSANGATVGRLVRRRQPLSVRVVVGVERIADELGDDPLGPSLDGLMLDGLMKVTVDVENTTSWRGTTRRRDDVMSHSLVATHTMLAVDDGVFLSLLDPPEHAVAAVSHCHSEGTFPVLVGTDDVILSSPIILYDHPQVAPESPGDLYDSTEIDEILALRVLTLTDAEKSEARCTDPRAAAIIERCDAMGPEQFARLHGIMRTVGADGALAEPHLGATTAPDAPAVPWWDPEVDAAADPWTNSIVLAGVEVKKGVAVRLWPSHRSDAQDLFLKGLRATVGGVFKDVDGSEQIAVTIDDDPATEELAWQGRYLFFHPDEVEPLSAKEASS